MDEEKMASSLGFTKSFTDRKTHLHAKKRGDAKQSKKQVMPDASRPPVEKEKIPAAIFPDKQAEAVISSPYEETDPPNSMDIQSEDEASEYYTYTCEKKRKARYKLRFGFGKFPRLVPVE